MYFDPQIVSDFDRGSYYFISFVIFHFLLAMHFFLAEDIPCYSVFSLPLVHESPISSKCPALLLLWGMLSRIQLMPT